MFGREHRPPGSGMEGPSWLSDRGEDSDRPAES